MLGDTIVHQQDCRRPLGMLRQVPPERLRVALDAMRLTGEALLMMMNGRSAALDELTGAGVDTLRSRV